MAQGLPLEVFADRKIKKWKARAQAKGVRIVEGVGVSPVEEMLYFWSKKLFFVLTIWNVWTNNRFMHRWVQTNEPTKFRSINEGLAMAARGDGEGGD